MSARRVAPRPHQTSVHKQTKVAVSHPSLPLQIPSIVDPGRSPPINCTHPPELQIAPFGATESIPDPNINLVFVAARSERARAGSRVKYLACVHRPKCGLWLRFTIDRTPSFCSFRHAHAAPSPPSRPAAPRRAIRTCFFRASSSQIHRSPPPPPNLIIILQYNAFVPLARSFSSPPLSHSGHRRGYHDSPIFLTPPSSSSLSPSIIVYRQLSPSLAQ